MEYVELEAEDKKKVPKDIDEHLNNQILFGFIWSIGAVLEEDSRPKFNVFLMELLGGEKVDKKYLLDLTHEWEP